MSEKNPKRGIYLLPNLLTTAALFSGFFAILAAIDGHYDKAALAIFLAMLLDTLDGRVARMTHTQTAFGAEYDSLSDMVAFGLAPGLVMYLWTLNGLGRLGWLVAFVYVAGAALRLARFNTKVETADKSYFEGLPSPAAAGVVVGCLWVAVDYDISPDMLRIPVAVLTAFAGLAMVSKLRYYSFKEIDFHGKVPYMLVVGATLAVAVVITEPPLVLFSLFFLYTFSGLITTLHSRNKA